MNRTRRESARATRAAAPAVFDAEAFLNSTGVARTIARYARGDVIFAQGDVCKHVMYVQSGAVKLSVSSSAGREAVVAAIGPGDFFGEGCLAGHLRRISSATATAACRVLVIENTRMLKVLHEQHALSDRFIAHMVSRHVRTEQDLIEQLFNSTEKRLARALLLLAQYGRHVKPRQVVPKVTEAALSKMAGITRARVDFFMKKFERLGFIGYKGVLNDRVQINNSLLSVVLHD